MTTSTATRFQRGDQVVFAGVAEHQNPMTILNVPGDRLAWSNCYAVTMDSVFGMGFAPEEELEPAPSYTVEDRAGLEALPFGTVYRDVEGDEIRKSLNGSWYLEGSELPWGMALLEEFLPGVILNPAILNENGVQS